MKIINAKGKICPLPLIETKKVYDTLLTGEKISVILDNDTACINVQNFIEESGGSIEEIIKTDTETTLIFIKGIQNSSPDSEIYCSPNLPVILISSRKMGRGNDSLGELLMKGFINTIADISPLPSHIIFLNEGVTFTSTSSPIVETLKELEKEGVKILSCGTCLDFFELKANLQVGKISNMYDILQAQIQAGNVIQP